MDEERATKDESKELVSTISKSDEASGSSKADVGDETPQQYMQSPFGTKIIPVPKSDSKKDLGVFKRPHEVISCHAIAIKKQRRVLSEDKFAEALEKIIQRECFPELEKLKAQNAYLDALANNDIQMMRELSSKYSVGKNTPSIRGVKDTPSTFETPSSIGLSTVRKGTESTTSTPIIHEPDSTLPPKDDDAQSVISEASSSKTTSSRKPHEMGLNEFLNKYTSEDDKSFQDIIDEGVRKHKAKYAWLYDQEEVHKERMQRAIELPTAADQQMIEYQRPSEIGTWTYKNKNAVMYIPDGTPYTSEEMADIARKQTEVQFPNTRFPHTPFKVTSKVGEPDMLGGVKPMNLIHGLPDGKVGVDGKEITAGQTPSVNGFKYVRTPSPTPGVEDTPFLTWGEIEGAPFRLDASDTPVSGTPGTPYKMMATSRRERLALELADKVSSRHRDKKKKTLEVAKSYLTSPSPRPKSSMDRMNSMSPAAQAFARNMLKKSKAPTPK
ncbi:unnamed protein product [Orchesella dallaii]|uniref:Protein DGCR14 n=1 Tax=Orchesella dallaii TaxID=48710 RepID=A0ABP1PXK2_9HEXA